GGLAAAHIDGLAAPAGLRTAPSAEELVEGDKERCDEEHETHQEDSRSEGGSDPSHEITGHHEEDGREHQVFTCDGAGEITQAFGEAVPAGRPSPLEPQPARLFGADVAQALEELFYLAFVRCRHTRPQNLSPHPFEIRGDQGPESPAVAGLVAAHLYATWHV